MTEDIQSQIASLSWVLSHYLVDEDQKTIRSPGKFQGEPVYAPYFYNLILDGCQDDTLDEDPRYPQSEVVDVFDVTSLDTDLWPQLRGVDRLYCFTDDQGFFHTETVER